MTTRPDWDDQFAETEDERNARLRTGRVGKTAIAELCALTSAWTIYDDIPLAQQQECREIGRKLHERGGETLMRSAYYEAKGRNAAASVAAAYWDGIGKWKW